MHYERNGWTTLIAGAVISFGAVVAAGACGPDASDNTTLRQGAEATVTEVQGNPACGDFDEDWQELKLEGDDLSDGTYTSSDGYLTVEITNFDGQTFDWSSNEGLDAAFVKGGPGGLLYSYDPEATSDTDLTAERNGKSFGVSHISFCYDIEFARISIGPSAVNEAGDSHTFDVQVEQKKGVDGSWEPASDSTTVDVTLTPATGASVNVSSDTCASPGTSNGICSVTFSSPTAGTVTGHASADVTIDNAVLQVETDGEGENSSSAVKRFVDASISIGPGAVNEVGDAHTFVVEGTVNDGTNGPAPVPDGTALTVTLSSSDGASATNIVDGCAANGTTDGTCTVTFESDTPGTVTGSATMTVTVDGLALTRTTDGTGSNSPPAVKRFVDAWIEIAADDVNEVRDDHTFTVTARMDTGEGSVTPVPDGTSVDVTLTATNGASVLDVTDACASAGTTDGTCTVSFRSDSAGLITGHAEMTLTIDGVTLSRATSGVGKNSSDVVKRYVDAWISIAPSAVNGIGEMHTFTVSAMQDAGDGTPARVADGTVVDVTLTASGDASVASFTDNCASGTTGGECTVSFTSPDDGTITGHASMTIELHGVTFTRETDGLHQNSPDAVKTFVDGVLTWVKVDGKTGDLLGGATFEVCRTHAYDSSADSFAELSSAECVTVTDVTGTPGSTGDQDADAGQFRLEELFLGRYTIAEATAPDGYEADSTAQTVDLTVSSATGSAALPFVNAPIVEDEGCTPGFWKNHPGVWDEVSDSVASAAGFTTSTSFNAFFGLTEAQSGFRDGLTMLDALDLGGGFEGKLARSGVAALLNIAAGLNYSYTNDASALASAITQAFINDDFEPLATDLDDANNSDCPLGN